MINSFPQEDTQKKCHEIVHETLGANYVNLSIGDFILHENGKGNKSQVKCKLIFSNDWENLHIKGAGAGVVDALFDSMLSFFCKDFFSLQQVQFEDFSMEIKFKSFKVRPTDAPVEMKIALINKWKKRIYFSAQSRSMMLAAIGAITKAFEYLINAETAFKQLQSDIKEAKSRNRVDLVNKYTHQAAELVSLISYEDVL